MVGSWIILFTSSLIYGSPIGISTYPLITSFMSPNVNRPIVNHSNVLGSLSHIIYKYIDESNPYCIIGNFCLTVPFCIPFLVCYFGFFSLDSSHSHNSSLFFLFCSYCSHIFLMLINPLTPLIDLLLFLLWPLRFFLFLWHLFSSSCIGTQVCYACIDRWLSHLCFVIVMSLPHSYVPSCIKRPL